MGAVLRPSVMLPRLHVPYFVCGKKGVMDEAFIHLENPLIFIKSRCLSLGISLFSKTEWYYIACFLYEFSVFLFIWQSKCQNLTFRQNVPSVSLPSVHPTPILQQLWAPHHGLLDFYSWVFSPSCCSAWLHLSGANADLAHNDYIMITSQELDFESSVYHRLQHETL